MVFSRQNWDHILYWSFEHAYGWRGFGGRVRGVSVLKDVLLKCISVDCIIFSCIAGGQPRDGFDTYFISAIAVGKCYRAEAVVDSPISRNCWVMLVTNSGSPSNESLSGMPLVAKVFLVY